MSEALQDRYAPHNRCFGCGPDNDKGLRLKSFVDGDETVCRWTPEPYHEAFEGVLAGGIVGTLLDCHSNWTAAYHLMKRAGDERPPCTVTADYHVKMMKPTPTDRELTLRARVVESSERRATVEASLMIDGVVTASCKGLFVAVQEGHPAYHRW